MSISLADSYDVGTSDLIIFFSGVIAISGMILPGLSGSYLLLLMGNYTLIMVDSVNALYFTLIESLSFDFTFIKLGEIVNTWDWLWFFWFFPKTEIGSK